MMHYEIDCSVEELKGIYVLLFEFITSFHLKYLDGELHNHISKNLWHIEALLLEYFKSEFIFYNGIEVLKSFPKEIIDAQNITTLIANNKSYPRVKYGDENIWLEVDKDFSNIPCHDCAALKGQYHVAGCDMEQCPKCGGQLFGCECEFSYDE
jgi:hypothetical protein